VAHTVSERRSARNAECGSDTANARTGGSPGASRWWQQLHLHCLRSIDAADSQSPKLSVERERGGIAK
jgi:hypothetical protein